MLYRIFCATTHLKTSMTHRQYVAANTVNVTNSFAVPFEEDDKDPTIWFLDHTYLETMFAMFKKVNGGPPSPLL